MNQNKIITKEQLDVINAFTCERLSSNRINKKLVKSFICRKNDNLSKYLVKDAWEDDENNVNAIYLIKTPEGLPCFYFGLKCGSLYKPLNKQEIEENISHIKKQIKKISEVANNKGTIDEKKIIDKLKSDNSLLSSDELSSLVLQYLVATRDSMLKNLNQREKLEAADIKREEGRNISRVEESYAGIELTHFCKNELYNEYLQKTFVQPAGKVFFWQFVFDIVNSVKNSVGAEYLYLFAADSSEDEELVNYYKDELKFKKENIGVIKPIYDFSCVFLSQKITEMQIARQDFLNNYNIDLFEMK